MSRKKLINFGPRDILADWLRAHGFDGLCHPAGVGCSCSLSQILDEDWCRTTTKGCRPGRLYPQRCSDPCFKTEKQACITRDGKRPNDCPLDD